MANANNYPAEYQAISAGCLDAHTTFSIIAMIKGQLENAWLTIF